MKRIKPPSHVKPVTINIRDKTFLQNSQQKLSNSTKHVVGQQPINFEKGETHTNKAKKKNEGPSDSANKPSDPRNDTTGFNKSTMDENSQANSWQKKISRDEQKSQSWFDWIMCGTCSTQPEFTDTERKSLESAGRAPMKMDDIHKA